MFQLSTYSIFTLVSDKAVRYLGAIRRLILCHLPAFRRLMAYRFFWLKNYPARNLLLNTS